ncbi:MAG TPA: hypothetical protein VGE07_06740 [Herpetosiphonaceae bacterium]
MIRYRPIIALLALVIGLSSLVRADSRPANAQASIPWGDKSSPFGMIVSLGNRVRSDEMETMIALMREAGVQWNREEISWDHVQFAPGGPFRWGGDAAGFYNYDRAIQLQADAGIQMLGLLDYNPAWFKSKNPHPEEWIDDWGDYVYQTVARYGRDRGQIKYWEIWNEPNLAASGYESGLYDVADYVRVLKVAQAAIRSADPEAKIVLGGVANIWSEVPANAYDTVDYLTRIADEGGWGTFDILGLHPYRPTPPEDPARRRDISQTFRQEMDEVDLLLGGLGRKPIWFTEIGWSTQSDGDVDELEAAAWMQRFMLLSLTRPGVEKVFWYDFRDDTGGPAHYTQPLNDPAEEQFHFGLLRRTYPLRFDDPSIRKPLYSAFYQLTHSLAGLSLQQVFADGGGGLYWQRWAGGNRSLDVIWRAAPEPGEYLRLECGCKDARIRSYDGTLERVLSTGDGWLTVKPHDGGLPLWVERGGERSGGYRFAQTAHTINGAFRTYWERNGGLPRFGLPLTDELVEPGPGRRPTAVQYFERNRFEHHPANQPQFQVLLGLLGNDVLSHNGIDWRSLPPAPQPAPADCSYFPETGHSLCWPFKQYWESHGGLPLYGFPLTEAFWEYDPERKEGRMVQYFERNRFEHHPEHGGTDFEVQLGLLGRQLYSGWAVWPEK